ncbi:unnamed protein product [Porites evermanni]|uniref:CCZ1/INTU/HSP4 first Longin domain-containing protein n=1 Tax=Porites evermanni TaxID=104178 RepID=A0ABN8MJP8_9CNID|nr:unnamed protein product [Porites evermanni]
MTALFPPGRATSFQGLIFFVYDREAVKKEADPPENAIVYFYPPSASIEDRISICGQLIGMSHFIHGFIGSRPALCKMQTEKVATVHSGKYTLALGGSLGEPDSLLIRQLETLFSLFTFYHGSLERVRMMCETQKQFLTRMNIIWDCYLHFVRHYGDFLPGVFDPLPFLDLPKRVAATCFTKASYILQACQRRKHILGGCILYSNSILCTQFEPSITERLILLKPNQSNLPARPVKTEHVLPFGVRILNAFLTLSEYLNLYDALSESAYRQSVRSDSTGAFPDMYTGPHSPETCRNPSEDLGGHKLQQHSSGDVASSNECSVGESAEKKSDSDKNCPENEVSAVPSDARGGHMLQVEKRGVDSEVVTITRGTEPLSSVKCKDESSEEVTWKTQGDGVSNISVEHSHEFGGRNRHVVITGVEEIESGSRALKAETGEESNECVVGNKASDTKDERNEVEAPTHLRSEVKHNETEAGSGVVTDRTKVDKRKNEVLDFLTRKRIGGKKDKGNAVIAREIEKPETDVSTASPQERVEGEGGANDTTSVRTKESSTGAFSKPEHRAMEKGDALSMAFDTRSCESLYDIGVRSMAFDSSCESNLSSVSLTMETVDVLRIKVVECSGTRFDKQERCEREQEKNTSVASSTTDDSTCGIVGSSENEETRSPVLNGLIPKVFQIFEDGNVDRKSLKSSSGSEKCCQACADLKKSSTYISTDSNVRGSHEDGGEVRSKETCTNKDPSSVETDSESGSEDLLPDDQETDFSETNPRDGERTNCGTDTDTDTPSSVEVKENSCKGLASRNELINTPVVRDSFAVRNLNSRSPEKFLEKSFVATAEDLKAERSDTPNVGANGKCSSLVENDSYEETSESRKTQGNVSENPVSSVLVDDRMSVPRSENEGTAKNASEILHSNGASNAEVDGGNPPTESLNHIEYDSEIHITNGHEGPAAIGVVGMPVDSAQEEIEGSSHDQWQEPQFPVQPEDDEGEALWFEEEGDDINQVEGLTHVNLYVQAHSKVVLILLAEEGLNTDCKAIKALWETSLNQLGELEFLVKQSSGDKPATPHSDEYSFLVYDGFERNMKGNLDELVHQVDHLFCETTQVLHEQFENCSTLKDVLLRNRSSTVYGKHNLGRGTYFHWKSPYRTNHGVPSCRDPFLKLEKRAAKVLNKDHGVNVF